MLHLIMGTIVVLHIVCIVRFNDYSNMLRQGIELVEIPDIKQRARTLGVMQSTHTALIEYNDWFHFWVPISIVATFNTIAVWILIASGVGLASTYTATTATVIAALFARTLTKQFSPAWLLDWLTILTNTRNDIDAEVITARIERLNSMRQDNTEHEDEV